MPDRMLDLSRLDELRGRELPTATRSPSGRSRRTPSCGTRRSSRHGFMRSRRSPPPSARHRSRTVAPSAGTSATPPLPAIRLPVLLAVDSIFECASNEGIREVPAREFWTGYRADRAADRTNCWCASASRSIASGRRASARSARARRRPSPRSCWLSATAMTRAPGATYAWPWDRWPPPPSARPPPRPCWRVRARARPWPTRPRACWQQEISPIDDVRSTADYRRSVSARVLHRLLREEGGW